MSSVNGESLMSSCQFEFLSFFCFLIAEAKISSTMLNNRDESGHPCLVTDLTGKDHSVSLLRMVLAVSHLYIAFMMLRYVLSIPAWLRVFIKKGFSNMFNALCASIDRIIWFFSFLLLIWCMMLIDL